jgi:hypothetical protein
MMRGHKATLQALTYLMTALPLSGEFSEIRARLQVYVPASTATIQEAKKVASFILEAVGVRLIWADCRTRDDQPSQDSVCLLPITSQDLQLRIIDEKMAKRAAKRSQCLGYAVVADGRGSIASAYYHRASEIAATNIATTGAILGGILAHEIGHLFGIRHHSRQGMMRAVWDERDLRALEQGTLAFTKEEARCVAASASSRTLARD